MALKRLAKFTPLQIILFSLFALLFLAAFAFFNKQFTTIKSVIPKKTFTNEETIFLSGLQKDLMVSGKIQDYEYQDWIMQDKRIPLKSKQIILGTTQTELISKYGDLTSSSLGEVDEEFLTPLQEKVNMFFISQGFSKNLQNTSLVQTPLYWRTLGFEKNELYCLARFVTSSDPFAYISCGTINEEQLTLQNGFNKIINSAFEQNNGAVKFRIDKIEGNFASGTITSYQGGGYSFIAKKTGNEWNEIWEGQESPSCSEMKQFGVPKTIYQSCFNTGNQLD